MENVLRKKEISDEEGSDHHTDVGSPQTPSSFPICAWRNPHKKEYDDHEKGCGDHESQLLYSLSSELHHDERGGSSEQLFFLLGVFNFPLFSPE